MSVIPVVLLQVMFTHKTLFVKYGNKQHKCHWEILQKMKPKWLVARIEGNHDNFELS